MCFNDAIRGEGPRAFHVLASDSDFFHTCQHERLETPCKTHPSKVSQQEYFSGTSARPQRNQMNVDLLPPFCLLFLLLALLSLQLASEPLSTAQKVFARAHSPVYHLFVRCLASKTSLLAPGLDRVFAGVCQQMAKYAVLQEISSAFLDNSELR